MLSLAALDEDVVKLKNREKGKTSPGNRKPDEQCGTMRNTLVFSHAVALLTNPML